MLRKLSNAVVEMAVRDQPMASEIGGRKTPRDSIPPNPTQVTTIPTATTIHP